MAINNMRVQFALASALGLTAFVLPASAQTTGTTIAANAAVTESCVVTSTALQFGGADVTDGAAHAGTGGLDVMCTSGTAWTATADVGTRANATMALRGMTSTAGGGLPLNYVLYNDNTATSPRGDGTGGTSPITGTGTGVVVPIVLAGSIPLGQTGIPAGTYADLVQVTVNY
ncbi:spore coat U domain-containing protein [Sphingomonas aerolata]|uniref:Csu type fimbrial protein n=1 Tax=Sphingomonas aerolata TaxID=185951 RepID=UPI002FE11FB0